MNNSFLEQKPKPVGGKCEYVQCVVHSAQKSRTNVTLGLVRADCRKSKLRIPIVVLRVLCTVLGI